jgi:hypothetical protein
MKIKETVGIIYGFSNRDQLRQWETRLIGRGGYARLAYHGW